MKYKKLRSTLEYRQAAWDRMKHELSDATGWTNEQIARRITELRSFSCDPSDGRERLLIELAVLLARQIIDA